MPGNTGQGSLAQAMELYKEENKSEKESISGLAFGGLWQDRRLRVAATRTLRAARKAGTASSTAAGSTATDGEKQVITVWTKDRHDATYIQGKIDEYNANNTNNVQVDYQLYTDNFDQAVDLAVQSDELPDILVLNDQVYNKYVNQGQWLDLYQYMDDDMKEYFKDEVYEGINEIDGKLYYIPTCGTTGRLIYNKEIFERVGISEPPTTMEEMVEDALPDHLSAFKRRHLRLCPAHEERILCAGTFPGSADGARDRN